MLQSNRETSRIVFESEYENIFAIWNGKRNLTWDTVTEMTGLSSGYFYSNVLIGLKEGNRIIKANTEKVQLLSYYCSIILLAMR